MVFFENHKKDKKVNKIIEIITEYVVKCNCEVVKLLLLVTKGGKMKDEINKRKVNNLLTQGNRLINLVYVLLIIIAVYTITLILEKLQVMPFFMNLLKVLTPLFIGFVLAWLFHPIVTWMQEHKIKRIFGALIVYAIFIGILVLMLLEIVPVIIEQVQTVNIAKITSDVLKWIRDFKIEGIDLTAAKTVIIEKVTEIATNFDAASIVTWITNTISSILSGIGTFAVGLIIGFFLLIDFDDVTNTISVIIPKTYKNQVLGLLHRINDVLKNFIRGTLYSSLIIFLFSLIGLVILKVPAAIVLALFCAIANVIPYVGPYIGAIPAAIIALTVSPLTCILVIIVLSVIQTVEGNLIAPIIMGKTVKLNPVTIVIGLLVFGYFYGMIGMIVATPIIAVIKELIIFFNEKYKFFSFEKGFNA